MKEIITQHQKSDMGVGFGYLENIANHNLKEVLDYYSKNSKTWGTVSICKGGETIRKFDYDTYNNNIFYHHLNGLEYNYKVKKVSFRYCFMNKDIDIYV